MKINKYNYKVLLLAFTSIAFLCSILQKLFFPIKPKLPDFKTDFFSNLPLNVNYQNYHYKLNYEFKQPILFFKNTYLLKFDTGSWLTLTPISSFIKIDSSQSFESLTKTILLEKKIGLM